MVGGNYALSKKMTFDFGIVGGGTPRARAWECNSASRLIFDYG